MAARQTRTTKRVKNLAAKKVGTKRSSEVKGGKGDRVDHQELLVMKVLDKSTP